ncbi:MAG: hypothetical protein KGY50_05215 [Candidatus Thermoplasmatota archaeon]|nr:hypothetical protein [Candidatus Thermoplasmatota archaeon]
MDKEDIEYTRKKNEILQIQGKDLRSKYSEALSIIPENAFQDYLLTRTRIRIGKELLPKQKSNDTDEKHHIAQVYQKAVTVLKRKPRIVQTAYDREDYGGKDRFYFYKISVDEIGEFTAVEQQFETTLDHVKNVQYEQLTAGMSEVDDEIFDILSKYDIIKNYKPSFDETLDKIIVDSMRKKVNA